MGRKHKSRLTVADIGRLPLVKMPDASPRQTLKQFQAEEEARIKAEERQRLEEVSRPLKEAARLASKRIAAYWSLPLSELQTNGIDFTPADIFGNYVEGPRDGKEVAEVATWKEFQASLASAGCKLSVSGGERLGAYMCSLAYHRGVALTAVANWKTALERLHSLQVFATGELTGYQSQTSSQTPEPRHAVIDPLSELESLNLDSRDGNRRAKELATEHFFSKEMAPIVDRWTTWLETTFGYVLTDEARKAAGLWWLKNPTESPLRGESWTQLRLNLVKRGVMPVSCKTPEEILMEKVEKLSDRSDSYDFKRNLRQEIRELAQ